MKAIQIAYYVCEKCNAQYTTEAEAWRCESRSISHDKGARVGSIVKILTGDGAGSLAKVTRVGVHDKDYGHHMWERYWHTVWLQADIIGSWGTRQLSFEDYELA